MNNKSLVSLLVIALIIHFSCKTKEHKPNNIVKAKRNLGNYYWAERSSVGKDTVYFSRTTICTGDTIMQIDLYYSDHTEVLDFSKSHKHFIHFKGVMSEGYDVQRFVGDRTIVVDKIKINVRKYYINKSRTTDAELFLYYSPRLGLFIEEIT